MTTNLSVWRSKLKTVGKIIKYVIYTIVFVACALIIGRIMLMEYEGKLSKIEADDVNRAAYAAADGELTLLTHDVFDEISKQGLFSAYKMIYIKEASQVQFTVRYNDSAFKYGGFEDGTEFTFYLYNETTKEFTKATCVYSDELLMYNYRRVVFDGIKLDDGANYYLHVSVTDSFDGSFDDLPIHYGEQEFEKYKLSDDERTALAN